MRSGVEKMIDAGLLRKADAGFLAGMEKRGLSLDLGLFARLDAERKEALVAIEGLRSKLNANAREVGQAKAKGLQADGLLALGAEISAGIAQAEERARLAQRAVDGYCEVIPNVPDESVAHGKGEADNVLVATVGNPTRQGFEREHQDVAEGLGGLRQDLAAKVAGSRFCVLAGGLARLQRALEGFMLDEQAKAGYVEMYVPLLVDSAAMYGTGQLPKFADDLFRTVDGRWLIPTAEVPLTNLLAGEILDEEALPLRFCAKTPCFRSEAGSAGRDSKGLIRQHQFEKVELVRFETPGASASAHEEMLEDAARILGLLELPYRIVSLCGGDLGFSAAKTYDLEVWLPGQGAYREISSVSNCKDFQSRRMGLRARSASGAKMPVHTLNGSGLAVGRALVAVLENFQDELGKVAIPGVLRDRMGGAAWLEREEINWGVARPGQRRAKQGGPT